MSSFKKLNSRLASQTDLRRSKRIKFLQGVDYSNQKFQSTAHVQFICDFLFIAEMLALRLVNRNLKTRIDQLKFYAGQKIKQQLIKIFGQELYALLEREGCTFYGQAMLLLLTGVQTEPDHILEFKLILSQISADAVLAWLLNQKPIVYIRSQFDISSLVFFKAGVKVIVYKEGAIDHCLDNILTRNTFDGNYLCILNPFDLVSRQYTFTLTVEDVKRIHSENTYWLLDKYYNLGFTCRNLSYKYQVGTFKPGETIRVSMYKIDGFIVWGRMQSKGDTCCWWSVPEILNSFRRYNPWDLASLIALFNKFGFRFPKGYAKSLKSRPSWVYDVTDNSYALGSYYV